jgi:predicted permease
MRLPALLHNIRLSFRSLSRNPGFTIVAVGSLTLGLTLSASTFAVVNAYLIRSFPYPHADRLYHVSYAAPGKLEPRGVSAIEWDALQDVVEAPISSAAPRFYITNAGYTQDVSGMVVSKSSIEALGVHATFGRSLDDADFQSGAEPVALIGHALWRDHFGADPNVIGKEFQASLGYQTDAKKTYRIIGILPQDFRDIHAFGRAVIDVVAPLQSPMGVYLIRLRPGVAPDVAQARLNAVAKNTIAAAADWPGVRLESVRDRYVAGMKPTLTAVTISSGLFLIIACANVAVLVLLRAIRRQREVAVRLALGGSRLQIGRMLVVEVCLVCLIAVLFALGLTWAILQGTGSSIEARLQAAPGGSSAIGIDATVLAMVGGIGLLIAVLLSLIPILSFWRDRLTDVLRRAAVGSDGQWMRHIRSGLIALEIGSIALFAGCGLMIRSTVNLLRTDLGFRTFGIVRARIALPLRTYPNAAALESVFDRLSQKLSAISREPFALTNSPPFFEPPKQDIEVDGRDTAGFLLSVSAVGPAFFRVLDIPIHQGRAFSEVDRLGSEPVAIVSETLAKRLWPNQNPVGRRLRTGEQPGMRSPLGSWRTIVGVSGDVRQTYTDQDLNDIYIPFFQAPVQFAPLFIRSTQPQSFWISTLRQEISAIDPEIMISESDSLEVEVQRQLSGTRFLASILTAFAILAGVVAAVGIYGVTAYAAELRSREVAIRIAIGATPASVVRMFVREAYGVLGAGLVGGVTGALAVVRLLETQLRGIRPLDPANLVIACILMTTAAIAATIWPAKRLARQSPLVALKED